MDVAHELIEVRTEIVDGVYTRVTPYRRGYGAHVPASSLPEMLTSPSFAGSTRARTHSASQLGSAVLSRTKKFPSMAASAESACRLFRAVLC